MTREDFNMHREHCSVHLIYCILMNTLPWFYYLSVHTSQTDIPPTLHIVLKMETLLKVS
jgi:hypothetical protein